MLQFNIKQDILSFTIGKISFIVCPDNKWFLSFTIKLRYNFETFIEASTAILISSKCPIVSKKILSIPASINHSNVSPYESSDIDLPGNSFGS